MEVFIFGLAALIGGFVLGSKLSAKAVAPVLSEVSNTQAIDRANFLQTLRRELANCSTRLSHDDDVGMKCSVKRGCLASQAFTAGVLCVL